MQRELDRKRQAIKAQIAALRCGLAADEEELQLALAQARGREEELDQNILDMARNRKADPNGVKGLLHDRENKDIGRERAETGGG
jgi:hypothetical protein